MLTNFLFLFILVSVSLPFTFFGPFLDKPFKSDNESRLLKKIYSKRQDKLQSGHLSRASMASYRALIRMHATLYTNSILDFNWLLHEKWPLEIENDL